MTFTPLNPLAGIQAIVSMAFGADPDGDPALWTWYDVTRYVRSAVTISGGRGDQAVTADAGRLGFDIDNSDGRFTPGNPNSPYFPYVVRNVPVRVQLTGFGDAAPYERAVRFVNGWPLTPMSSTDVLWTKIAASGRLRRLQTRSRPLRSALTRTVSAMPGLIAHWPLEDGSLASYGAATSSTVPAMTRTGSITFASAGPAGSGPLPDFTGGGSLLGTVPGAPAGAVEVGFVFRALQTVDSIEPLLWRSTTGMVLSVFANAGDTQFTLIPGDGGVGGSTVIGRNLLDGQWHAVQLTAKQNGADIDTCVTIDGIAATTPALATSTLGAFRTIQPGANELPLDLVQKYNLGELYVVTPTTLIPGSAADFADAVDGYAAELATDRVDRLAGELSILATVSAGTVGTVQAMGPQAAAQPLSVLQDVEKVDGGRLHDCGPGGRLVYLANNIRYNASVGLALDYNRHLRDTFAGTFDDQGVLYASKLSRPGGSSAEYAVASSEGDYDEGLDVNVADDSQLLYLAEQHVAVGSYPDMRFPVVDVDLFATPDLAQQVVATTIGTRMSISNLPVPKYPPGVLDQFIEGFTETIDIDTWTISYNCTPGGLYRAAVVEGATNPWIVDAGDSALNAGIGKTDLSMSVKTTAGALWSTSAGDYPRDVVVDGEQIRITAMAGAASPQTATIVRSINGIAKTHLANAVVKLYRPAVIAL